MLNTSKYCLREKKVLRLHFEVSYRRILFVMSISTVYYFSDQNSTIPRTTASDYINLHWQAIDLILNLMLNLRRKQLTRANPANDLFYNELFVV